MKILIVDDNANDRRLLALNLKRHGCGEIMEACDGQEGLEMARRQRPDVIVSDALMPRLDGFQFLRMVKTDPELAETPFVFHSSVYTGDKDEKLAFRLGAEAFIPKPKEPDELWRELDSILKRVEKGGETPHTPALMAEEREYLRKYSGVVAAKLEEKVHELETALTRQKEAEGALRLQFAQFSTIFDSLHALIYVADTESGRIIFMNRYGVEVFGDFQGRECRDLFPLLPGAGCCGARNGACRGTGRNEPLLSEFHSPHNDRWYQGIDRSIVWTDGRIVRLHIAFDITERKEIERIKDGMISAVSHEMRTPLTALMGYTELMLADESLTPRLTEYLKIVEKEAARLDELIGNFIDIQRQRANHGAASFRLVSIPPLMEETAAVFRAASDKHRVVVETPPDLPPVLGDERLLRRMLEMLVANAVKFSPGGGEVAVRASLEAGVITVVVQDQGIGMPAEELEAVFDLFYRVDNSDRRMFGGTGLGLALVKEIAIGHGGRAWAESREGHGSSFFFSLPACSGRGASAAETRPN